MDRLESKVSELYDYIVFDAIDDSEDFLHGIKEINFVVGGDEGLEDMIKDVQSMKRYLEKFRLKQGKHEPPKETYQ